MDSEKIAILRRMYVEGSAAQQGLREQHPSLASMLEDLFDAAEFGNHIVSPQGIQAMAVGMCEVLYPELDEETRIPDEEDLRRAAKILLAQVTSAEAASKGRVS
jgi:hypothetical protein